MRRTGLVRGMLAAAVSCRSTGLSWGFMLWEIVLLGMRRWHSDIFRKFFRWEMIVDPQVHTAIRLHFKVCTCKGMPLAVSGLAKRYIILMAS